MLQYPGAFQKNKLAICIAEIQLKSQTIPYILEKTLEPKPNSAHTFAFSLVPTPLTPLPSGQLV